jgi:adenylate cyclase
VQGTRAVAGGNFQVSLKVPSRDEIGLLTTSFNDMARSLREKEMIKRAFTRYVARQVVEEILKDPEHLVLSGERREATVLFCDIRNFTPMTERLSPEEVIQLLNDFYTLAIETTFEHDGTLDKFMGDAVMAVFGHPSRIPITPCARSRRPWRCASAWMLSMPAAWPGGTRLSASGSG